MKHLLLSILVSASLATGYAAEPLKQFVPGEIWPDNNGVHINAHGGGVLFHDGTYYWFGEHKIEGGAGNVAHVGVHVYSSQDLYNWKDEGIALTVSNDPEQPDRQGLHHRAAQSDLQPQTGKFVMWFHHELLGRKATMPSLSGVAVADNVTGPYTYHRKLPPECRRLAGECAGGNEASRSPRRRPTGWPKPDARRSRAGLSRKTWFSAAISRRPDGARHDAVHR